MSASRSPAREGARPYGRIDDLLAERAEANHRFFDREAERLSLLSHRMAERFADGGRLLAIGVGACAHSDARHVAVEFAHPVIVGKRALPALAIGPDSGSPLRRTALLARAQDVVVAFASDEREVQEAVAHAHERGCLTIGLPLAAASWTFDPPSMDPFIRQELLETLYHLLWETVHVFFEHPGLLDAHDAARGLTTAAAPAPTDFLYPFLQRSERDAESVRRAVSDSIRSKAAEVTALRRAMLDGCADELSAAARSVRASLDAGGTVLAFGNGGSATDAMDVVADFADPPPPWPPRPALDLTLDPSILTALANDVGTESIFARQVIAYGRRGDVALAFSTSGSSRNVVRGLEEARRRGMVTVAFVGGDGGLVRARSLAEHVVHAPSDHIPRIQEAHATAYHVLRELVETVDGVPSAAAARGPAP